MQKLIDCKVLKEGDCSYGPCWHKALKMAYRSKLVLRLFLNDCIIAKILRILLGMPLDGTAATVLLDVHLVILLLMRDNYEV
jgi:hypothetical protein